MLKRFLIMGGAVTSHGNTENVSAEFNIMTDPEAAHIVFEAWHENEEIIHVIDWEATIAHAVPLGVFERWAKLDTPRAHFFSAISAKTMEYVRTVSGRDMLLSAHALVMSVALEPDIVKRAQQHFVTVESSGRFPEIELTGPEPEFNKKFVIRGLKSLHIKV